MIIPSEVTSVQMRSINSSGVWRVTINGIWMIIKRRRKLSLRKNFSGGKMTITPSLTKEGMRHQSRNEEAMDRMKRMNGFNPVSFLKTG
jgi:hypothetical protein